MPTEGPSPVTTAPTGVPPSRQLMWAEARAVQIRRLSLASRIAWSRQTATAKPISASGLGDGLTGSRVGRRLNQTKQIAMITAMMMGKVAGPSASAMTLSGMIVAAQI